MYINLKRKHIVIWSIALLIIILLIIFLALKTSEITYGKKLVLDDNTLDVSSYYTEYDATIVSNKNVNIYFVKEWYKEGVGSRIEYLDYMKNIVTIITTPTDCYIFNTGNKAYVLTQNVYGTNNILSLATFTSLYNNEANCNCSKNIYEKDGEINILFKVCNEEGCLQNEVIKNLGITLFELRCVNNKPISYTVYTGDKKEYACIVYNKFDMNMEILDDTFNIDK